MSDRSLGSNRVVENHARQELPSAVAATLSGTNKIEVVSLDYQSCLF